MSANVGVMEWVACGFGVHRQGVIGLQALPLLDHRVNCINESVLGN